MGQGSLKVITLDSGAIRYEIVFDVYVDGARRQCRRRFARKKDAQAALAQGLAAAGEGLHAAPGRMTVADLLQRWLDAKEGHVDAGTVIGYRRDIASRVVPALGRLQLARLTSSDVERWQASLLREGLSANRIRVLRSILGGALGYAVKHGLVARNVSSAVPLPPLPPRQAKGWTVAEARRFLAATSVGLVAPSPKLGAEPVSLSFGERSSDLRAVSGNKLDDNLPDDGPDVDFDAGGGDKDRLGFQFPAHVSSLAELADAEDDLGEGVAKFLGVLGGQAAVDGDDGLAESVVPRGAEADEAHLVLAEEEGGPVLGFNLDGFEGRASANELHGRSSSRAMSDHALWTVALYTGMRIGEILALRWADVDLERGVVHVRSTVKKRVRGEDGRRAIGPPKGKKTRVIPLAAPARSVLVGLLPVAQDDVGQVGGEALVRFVGGRVGEERFEGGGELVHRGVGREFVVADGDKGGAIEVHPSSFVFPSPRTGHAQGHDAVGERLRTACKRAGVPILTFHGLRHSCATLLMHLGVHPAVVSALLGHSTVKLTLDVYSHVSEALLSEAVESLASAVGG